MSINAHRTERVTGSEGREEWNGTGGKIRVWGGNGDGNSVGGGNGDMNVDGERDGARVRTEVAANKGKQDGNGAATGTEMEGETRRVVQRLGRAGIRRFRPRKGHQNSPFRG